LLYGIGPLSTTNEVDVMRLSKVLAWSVGVIALWGAASGCGGQPAVPIDGSALDAGDGGSDAGDGGVAEPCASGTYDDDADAATVCLGWTACEAGQYVSTAGTATSDQVCAGCASGTFSTGVDATECAPWTACEAGTFVTTEGSAAADQTCADCEAGTYTTDANQSMCVTADDCPPGTEQTAPV